MLGTNYTLLGTPPKHPENVGRSWKCKAQMLGAIRISDRGVKKTPQMHPIMKHLYIQTNFKTI